MGQAAKDAPDNDLTLAGRPATRLEFVPELLCALVVITFDPPCPDPPVPRACV